MGQVQLNVDPTAFNEQLKKVRSALLKVGFSAKRLSRTMRPVSIDDRGTRCNCACCGNELIGLSSSYRDIEILKEKGYRVVRGSLDGRPYCETCYRVKTGG